MRTSFLLLLVIGVVAVVQAATMPAAPTFGLFGEPRPRPLDRRRIQGLGKWAEAEHAKRSANDEIIFGGLRPLKNIYHPKIQGLGQWAVAEHVKRANDGLKFGRVVGGEDQLVAGMNYFLLIQVLNGNGGNGLYKARVYEPLEESPNNTRELVSFGPAN
ncbi:hypothetical protein ACQ4PT_071945 [Festuca glaucescens]